MGFLTKSINEKQQSVKITFKKRLQQQKLDKIDYFEQNPEVKAKLMLNLPSSDLGSDKSSYSINLKGFI